MQQHILTDDISTLDQAARRWWIRVLRLVTECGCSIELAIQAVELADQTHRTTD